MGVRKVRQRARTPELSTRGLKKQLIRRGTGLQVQVYGTRRNVPNQGMFEVYDCLP